MKNKFGKSDADIESDIIDALIGFHALSGNHDQVSSFFRKGKIICFKTMAPSSLCLNVSKSFGDSWEIVAKDFAIFEHFLCKLYKSKQKSVDSARFEKFIFKIRKENKSLRYFCSSNMSLKVLN